MKTNMRTHNLLHRSQNTQSLHTDINVVLFHPDSCPFTSWYIQSLLRGGKSVKKKQNQKTLAACQCLHNLLNISRKVFYSKLQFLPSMSPSPGTKLLNTAWEMYFKLKFTTMLANIWSKYGFGNHLHRFLILTSQHSYLDSLNLGFGKHLHCNSMDLTLSFRTVVSIYTVGKCTLL